MKKIFFVFAFLFLLFFAQAQKTDKRLQSKIEETISGFNGDIGIYVKSLKNGKIVSINADTIFPTASIVKVPIMLGVMDKMQKGELNYDQQLVYKDSLLYEAEDIVDSFNNGKRIC